MANALRPCTVVRCCACLDISSRASRAIPSPRTWVPARGSSHSSIPSPTGTTMERRKAVSTEATRSSLSTWVIIDMELMKTVPVTAPTATAARGSCSLPVDPR